jgi:hypothetical protein
MIAALAMHRLLRVDEFSRASTQLAQFVDVIRATAMQRAAVIPHQHIVTPPDMAVNEFSLRRVFK